MSTNGALEEFDLAPFIAFIGIYMRGSNINFGKIGQFFAGVSRRIG
jgi:hypothetical protein